VAQVCDVKKKVFDMNSKETVCLKDVYKTYPLGKTEVKALQGVSFSIAQGEFATLAGPSGCGKSTLLNLIGCMDTASGGEVYLEGTPLSPLSDKQLTALRLNKLGFIFQSFNLIPVLSVYQNVEFPLLIQGNHTRKEREQKVEGFLAEVGLAAQAHQRASELSGGQRQRVAIARALVTSPKVVLADEPTANLDSENGTKVLELMQNLNKQQGTTFIFSTHDPQVMSYASRMIKLKDGKVISES
jgi:putative ABC transport system ATP-binding protein